MPERLERVDEMELPRVVGEAIQQACDDMEEGLTSGKKRPDDYNHFSGIINVIPGKYPGPCTPYLVTYIYDGDPFDRRVLESLNFVLDPEQCFGVCHDVTIITTQWAPRVLDKYRGLISSAKREGVIIRFKIMVAGQTITKYA